MIALRWTSGLLIGFAPPSELPIHLAVNIDATVVWFTALLAIGRAAVRGRARGAAAPADVAAARFRCGRSRVWPPSPAPITRGGTGGAVDCAPGRRGLCLRSLNQAARLTPGFQADGVVVGWLDLFSAGYNAEQGRAFYARVIDRVRTMPGVESASLSRRIPLGFSGGSFTDVTVEGHRDPTPIRKALD